MARHVAAGPGGRAGGHRPRGAAPGVGRLGVHDGPDPPPERRRRDALVSSAPHAPPRLTRRPRPTARRRPRPSGHTVHRQQAQPPAARATAPSTSPAGSGRTASRSTAHHHSAAETADTQRPARPRTPRHGSAARDVTARQRLAADARRPAACGPRRPSGTRAHPTAPDGPRLRSPRLRPRRRPRPHAPARARQRPPRPSAGVLRLEHPVVLLQVRGEPDEDVLAHRVRLVRSRRSARASARSPHPSASTSVLHGVRVLDPALRDRRRCRCSWPPSRPGRPATPRAPRRARPRCRRASGR